MHKHVRFSHNRHAPPTTPDTSPLAHYGLVDEGIVYETDSLWGMERLEAYPLEEVRLLPPCWPTKIVCVGRNYADHAKELGNPIPEEPLIFYKPPSSLAAAGDAIVYPSFTRMLSYEGELGLVIGRQARAVSRERAMDYVYGYTIVNDITARDLQKKDGQWARAKGSDTFCPVGPWVAPRSEVDFSTLRIRTWVNGQIKQDGSVLEMLFPPDVIIAYVTQFLTLEPGDLIATGTPPGVGLLEPGDTVRVEISGIGVLENTVIRG